LVNPPGLTPDVVARLIAEPLSVRLGQQVIVDNRPGAGSNIATEAVLRAPPDGYTLLDVTITNAINATLYYCSPGFGTANNIAGELFKMMAGVDLVHVPYRGSYMPDLIAGQTQLTFTPLATAIEFIKSGKLRVLAVTGATRRMSLPWRNLSRASSTMCSW
jgi:tripartite-type tricarboxylate transporter receptor subunit TctC